MVFRCLFILFQVTFPLIWASSITFSSSLKKILTMTLWSCGSMEDLAAAVWLEWCMRMGHLFLRNPDQSTFKSMSMRGTKRPTFCILNRRVEWVSATDSGITTTQMRLWLVTTCKPWFNFSKNSHHTRKTISTFQARVTQGSTFQLWLTKLSSITNFRAESSLSSWRGSWWEMHAQIPENAGNREQIQTYQSTNMSIFTIMDFTLKTNTIWWEGRAWWDIIRMDVTRSETDWIRNLLRLTPVCLTFIFRATMIRLRRLPRDSNNSKVVKNWIWLILLIAMIMLVSITFSTSRPFMSTCMLIRFILKCAVIKLLKITRWEQNKVTGCIHCWSRNNWESGFTLEIWTPTYQLQALWHGWRD